MKVISEAETEEKLHLEKIKTELQDALARIDARLARYEKEISEDRTFLWEHKSDMDHLEKISMRQAVDQSHMYSEAAGAKKARIQKLVASPYFGRFDFLTDGGADASAVYVGVHAFFDERDRSLIHDWRAPISTLFYDYESGPARYQAPSGEVAGEITLKRQFRIRDGELKFVLESALNIHDDVLQEELSRSSDDKMGDIVKTIQRDQNAIIRDERSHALIIQGVAGSGKTSIALHRIAFLLYRFKDTLSSSDMLIISPNKVYADYISNVLPELGEEKIPEIEIERLADELLNFEHEFQTSFELAAALLEEDDPALRKRIREKSSFELMAKLDEYVSHIEAAYFSPEDMRVNDRLVPAWFLEERWRSYRDVPVFKRLDEIADDIERNIELHYRHEATTKERAEIKSSVRKMFKLTSLRALYKDFYAWLGKPALFKPAARSTLEYSDVFPLIYLKLLLEGVPRTHFGVKHLLVDEMQDYTPVQYAVLARLFPCKKTILGDTYQSVNPYASSTLEAIRQVFTGAECIKLCKSYRSTYEITRFAQGISPNPELIAIERHGERPLVVQLPSAEDEIGKIRSLLEDFRASDHQSMGIICKTQKQADKLHAAIAREGQEAFLLSSRSTSFVRGIVVCTAHMAKGLEFDQVIVPHATEENYATEMDRNLLYVACTRAMHRLTLTCAGPVTRLISPEKGG